MTEDNNLKIHSIPYNILMGVILKVTQVIFPIITFPYISRVLLPEGVGEFNFVSSTINIFSVIAMLGIPIYGIRVCAKCRDDKVQLSKTVLELLIINSIAVFVTFILLFGIVELVPQYHAQFKLFFIFSFSILFTAFGVEWFYQSIEQYDYITIRSFIAKVISIVLMFLCVKDSGDLLQYGIVTVIGTVGSNLFNIIRLHKYICISGIKKIELKKHIKPIFILFAFSAVTTIYTSFDSVMLGFLSSNTEIGYYSAGVKLKNLLVSFVTVFASVLLPRCTYLISQNRYRDFKALICRSNNLTFMLSTPLVFFCIKYASDIIQFLSGSFFSPAFKVVQVIAPSIIFIGVSQVIGMQFLIPLNKERDVLFSTLAGACVNVILNYFLIPLYGATGAGIATTIAELVVLVVQLFFVGKLIIKLFSVSLFLKSIGASLFAIIINFNFLSNMSLFIKLITEFLCFISLYIIFLFLLGAQKTIKKYKD